jgi:predicted nucleotidyltransferase
MEGSPHYKELLQLFEEYGVEYLVVGGYAVMKYAEPRFTKDLDIWVRDSPTNSKRVFDALTKFGAPVVQDGVTPSTFTQDVVYQIGVVPVRVDIMTHISGVRFEDAWLKRVQTTLFGVPASFISLEDLIANKQAAGRSDLEHLEQILRKSKLPRKTRRRPRE